MNFTVISNGTLTRTNRTVRTTTICSRPRPTINWRAVRIFFGTFPELLHDAKNRLSYNVCIPFIYHSQRTFLLRHARSYLKTFPWNRIVSSEQLCAFQNFLNRSSRWSSIRLGKLNAWMYANWILCGVSLYLHCWWHVHKNLIEMKMKLRHFSSRAVNLFHLFHYRQRAIYVPTGNSCIALRPCSAESALPIHWSLYTLSTMDHGTRKQSDGDHCEILAYCFDG